jgi:hypothetical protein
MVRNSTRKSRHSGLFGRLWSPFGHALMASEESVGAVTNTAKGVVRESARGVNRIGKSITGHFNAAVTDLVKRRKSRKNSRRNTRRNTRSTRRNTRR